MAVHVVPDRTLTVNASSNDVTTATWPAPSTARPWPEKIAETPGIGATVQPEPLRRATSVSRSSENTTSGSVPITAMAGVATGAVELQTTVDVHAEPTGEATSRSYAEPSVAKYASHGVPSLPTASTPSPPSAGPIIAALDVHGPPSGALATYSLDSADPENGEYASQRVPSGAIASWRPLDAAIAVTATSSLHVPPAKRATCKPVSSCGRSGSPGIARHHTRLTRLTRSDTRRRTRAEAGAGTCAPDRRGRGCTRTSCATRRRERTRRRAFRGRSRPSVRSRGRSCARPG